jgi:hypothetical protein
MSNLENGFTFRRGIPEDSQKLSRIDLFSKAHCLATDPYATGFYSKLGAVQIGTVQSKIKPGLFLPHMEFKF